ncbi:MAG: sel1 repeat family protein, partial [Victivallales bacterium]|nr:sel1 repeat family protein [Victivallales bacterium]
ATEYLAFSYMYDEEVPDWEAKTTALLKELIDIGYPFAEMELFKLKMGDDMTLGKMSKAQQKEFDRLVKQLEKRGEQKDSNAYLELAFIFGDYIIGEQKRVEDFRKAAAPARRAEEYYRKAAALGNRSAFYHLGIMNIVTDHDKAIEYLETAAARGDMDALGALCVGDVVVLSMMKTDAAKVLGGQEKLDAFLSDCARHLKRREKYGMEMPLYESEVRFGNIPEGMTFAQLLSKLKDMANSGNSFSRQVLERYEKLP